ncbi:uncharacterized protein [Rutidosis leptorrhynchoides]|uniref:uncharacterized protein n=1 Tax=Rutidosis leptorrhynchoides TaxID=125765 RepID=UPI003A99590F
MNFFQSVFADDPDPSDPEPESTSEPDSSPSQSDPPIPNPTIPTITSAWTFGSSLMKTLASKSESVIETYRRDLEDFSSGIKKETAVIRQATVNVLKDLPASLETGAGLAQESLESVGQAIDDLGNTVTEIIAQGKDSILAADYCDSDSDVTDSNNISRRIDNIGISKPYSRLDAQIRTIQSDMNTYLNEPEDLVEYSEWKLGFKIGEKVGEINDVMNEKDGVVGEIFSEIVPSRVDQDSFWSRYFYRVYKIKKAEEARVKLVKRAISAEEDEELSWDVDEDDYEENAESDMKVEEKEPVGSYEKEKKDDEILDSNETKGDKMEVKSDVKTGSEGKTDKDSDISIVSSQPSPEEDEWDEIEDLGSSDENKEKAASHGSPDRAELRKRLSVAEEDEDLTWDIEDDDDDETVKA